MLAFTETFAVRRRRTKAATETSTALETDNQNSIDLLTDAVADLANPPMITDSATSAEVAKDSAEVTSVEEHMAKPTRAPEELANAKRKHGNKIARDQRKRHTALLAEWMPTQRGAVIAINTTLGHQAVESWFKRTYLKHARMLWKVHTFPRSKMSYEDVAKIEQSCLDSIARCEAKMNVLTAQLDALIDQSASNMAFYQGHYALEVIVSTRTAARLHPVYVKADAIALRLDTLSLHGLITQERYAMALSETHKAVFGLCKRIEQLYTGIYIRAGTTAPALEEDDGTQSVGRGDTPHDQLSDPAIVAVEVVSAEQVPALNSGATTEEIAAADAIA